MLMLIAPIRRLADVASPITRSVAALERGLHLLGDTPAERAACFMPSQVRGAIALQDVSVALLQIRRPR